MATYRKVRRGAIASAALWGLWSAAAGQAQQTGAEGGFLGTFSISPRLVYSSDGGDERGLVARTNLGLAVRDITKSQQFFIEATGQVEEGLSGDADSPTGIDRPRFDAGYSFETRETEIALTASYAERDVDDSFADPDTGFLILDEGTREDLSLGLAVAFGRESPFGGTFRLSRLDTNVANTTDDRLEDSVTNRAGLGLRFRLGPRIAATLGGDVIDIDSVDRDRRTERLTTGAELAVTPTLTADVELGYDRVIVEEDGARETDDGLSFGLGLAQDRPRGGLTGNLSSRVTENGRRTRLDFGQSVAFPASSLSYGLGLVFEDGGVDPLYSLAYSKAFARAELNLALQQSYFTDIEGNEAIGTLLSAAYTRALTPEDQITGNISLQDTSVQSGDADDARRAAFDVTYSRLLTRDWSLVGGVGYSRNAEGEEEEESDSEVFVGLERTFSWRR